MKKSKYWQTALLLNLLFLFSCFAPTQIVAQTTVGKKLTPREIAQQTLPSTVLLVMGNSSTKKIKSGSGFFVAEDVVATNFHVIKDTTEGYAKIYGQEKIYKILGTVGIDEKNDLALLKISSIKGKPLKLNTDDSIAIVDEVFAVGNPEGLEGTFSQGIVSSIRKTDKFNLLQITASISEGSSGGAVLNDKAEVVGVAVGAIESGQSLNFAIPISFLRSLISSQKSVVALTSSSSATNNNQSSSKNEQNQSKTVIQNNPLSSTSYRLPFKTPDTIQENLLGKVKSIKGSVYFPELKFGNWALGNKIDTKTTIYNSDGYVELFEELNVPPAKPKVEEKDIITTVVSSAPSSCSISDLVSEIGLRSRRQFPYNINNINRSGFPNTSFTYREIYAYNYSANMVERKILHKCANCSIFTLAEKIYTKYEGGEIIGFDSNGELTFKTTEKSINGKKIQIFYDAEGKIKCKIIEDETSITEYYNADGKLMGKERKKSYKVRSDEITEIWLFNDQKKAFELFMKTTKTEVPNGLKVTTETLRGLSSTITKVFAKDTKLLIEYNSSGFVYLPGKYKYEYEFDSAGNWIKKTSSEEVTKFGKTYFEPYLITKREIAYY